MGARLRDVAERAAVSVKTVSNVVNASPKVSPGTRARVQEAIDELGYRPNLSARHLRQGRTGIIALAVPDLNVPYFSELAAAVIAEAKKRSVTVLIEDTGGDRSVESAVARGHSSSLIDGVILSPLALRRGELVGPDAGRVPLVLLGERDYAGASDHVVIDNVAAAREATAHLLDAGRSRIAVIGSDDRATGRQRITGYREALTARGVPVRAELMPVTGEFTRASGASVMRSLLAERPDAVFCFNDLLALGALRTLLTSGLRVPEDVALVGFDDIEDGRYATPTLTTVAPDKTKIAKLAVSLLLDRIDAADHEKQPVLAQAGHRLVIRESTPDSSVAAVRGEEVDAR